MSGSVHPGQAFPEAEADTVGGFRHRCCRACDMSEVVIGCPLRFLSYPCASIPPSTFPGQAETVPWVRPVGAVTWNTSPFWAAEREYARERQPTRARMPAMPRRALSF